LEDLSHAELLSSAADVSGWRRQHLMAALRGIAKVHAIWYGRKRELAQQPWIGYHMSAAAMAEMKDLWSALADHAAPYFAQASGANIPQLQQDLIASVDEWWQPLENQRRTLI